MKTDALEAARTWPRLHEVLKHFWRSEVGKKAALMLATLFLLLLAVNALNVVNSYVGRDFITALAERRTDQFIYQSLVYIGVFAASTLVAVYYRFVEERLGLIWRNWYTQRLILAFLKDRTYFRLKEQGGIENPDERITEDVKSFTVTTLSFLLLLLNGSITVLAFSGVIWSISPTLFGVTVLYSTLGSYLAVKLGRPLITLNYNQLDKEANFRSTLIHLWQNAESVSLAQREDLLQHRLLHRLDQAIDTGHRIIKVHRNLGYFTTSYNYLIQILPVLVVAPLYLRGEVEFGVITQATMAFAHLVGAFSLIVNQFQSISSFAAVIARLGALGQVIEQAGSGPGADPGSIRVEFDNNNMGYRDLTLRSQDEEDKVLIAALNLSVATTTRIALTGSNEAAKDALFRATAGLRESGKGLIRRPWQHHMLFLPEQPYLPPGTLREVLVRIAVLPSLADGEVTATLNQLGFDQLLARIGGLDSEKDWMTALSLAEQQQISIAAALLAETRMIFLNRAVSAIPNDQIRQVFKTFQDRKIGYLVIGNMKPRLVDYDGYLEISEDGRWHWEITADKAI